MAEALGYRSGQWRKSMRSKKHYQIMHVNRHVSVNHYFIQFVDRVSMEIVHLHQIEGDELVTNMQKIMELDHKRDNVMTKYSKSIY